ERDVRLLLHTDLSVVVSREFKTPEDMMQQVEDVNIIRRDFYGRGEEIIYLSEIVLNSEYYEVEVERIKKLMLDAIQNKEEALIILYADRLVETMGHGHVVSRIYVHHVFYDILLSFYEQYRVHDKTRLFEIVDLLLSYKSSDQILDKLKHVLNEVLKKPSNAIEDTHTIAEKIQNIIHDEYGTDLSLDELAGRVNLAPAYVSYLFKKETGNTIVKYITDYRMEKARQWLDDRELKIVQVGKTCGYENQPYFNRLFKNYHGVTPRQYRDKNG
ncbi:MAG: AraC family transcriptional regulator, partial [Hungatella sp.]